MPLLLFVLMPILEMWILIEVGSKIGAPYTIGLVLLTAMIGLALLRRQSFSAITRANQKMQTGEMPLPEMIEGIFLAVGGALLLTPGFITDAIGFCCLLPGVRNVVLGRMLKKMVVTQQGGYYTYTYQQRRGPQSDASDDSVIEGEFERDVDPDQRRLK
ncbi:MAG: membrane protein FxsA [Candidatus Pelagadaptatus aseana]|uniref:FxsA family protein n=1 Tax=Candidatus Pelagadaptatus aseana TaxID=3120508 RepID=UPI0039B20023